MGIEKEEVNILEDSVEVGFKVITKGAQTSRQQDWQLSEQLVEGLEGKCITGQRRKCPKGHNCGKVKITTSVPPLFIQISPLEVKN